MLCYPEKPCFFLSPASIQANESPCDVDLLVNVFNLVETNGKVDLCDIVIVE